MKKSVLFIFVFTIFLFVGIQGVYAADNVSDTEMIQNAYACLEDRIEEKGCGSMTIEELIFSTMANGECEDELRNAAQKVDDELECWPSGSCDVTTTAQAMMALNLRDSESDKIVDWFNEQRMVPRDMDWYLQIDTQNQSSCSITYNGNTYTTQILENKMVDQAAGPCLRPSPSGFWLTIQQSCYETEFEVSCDDRFVTNLLFKEKTSDTIQVSRKVSSEPANGIAIEKIDSFCFREGVACDYEGTLWAATALGAIDDYEILRFVPYLITAAETNKDVFYQPLLFMITGYDNYRIDILDRQIAGQYWKLSNGRYFDTALALFPFADDEFEEKTNAINWLREVQDEDGCWDNGNIVSNGFLLSSVWPRYWSSGGGSGGSTPDNDCIRSGYYCENVFDRGTAGVLSAYACAGGSQKCYENPSASETCAEAYPGSDICNSNEICPTNKKIVGGETCCVGAICQLREDPQSTTNECELFGGTCATSCGEGEIEETIYANSCIDAAGVCCVQDRTKQSGFLWLWILFALIILITIAIIYRDKIKEWWLKRKAKGNGGASKALPNADARRPMNQNAVRQRRIIPNTARPSQPQRQPPRGTPQTRSRPRPKNAKELDDVLRKLKDMSK